MVDPSIIAIFLLLLRPFHVLEGAGELDDCVGVGVMTLELATAEGEVEAVMRLEVAGKRATSVVLPKDVLILDMLVADVVWLVVGTFEADFDTKFSPPSCELVQNTGFVPLFITMLKSLLINVGGVALNLLKSDTSKWHTHSFPSSRGTRAEPVAETE